MNVPSQNAGLLPEPPGRETGEFGTNVQRLMARAGFTISQVAQRAGLDERTIQAILQGRGTRPHARTLQKLAAGLDAHVDELYQNPSVLAYRHFDRQTNPVVDEVVAHQPALFDGWTAEDFDELYSHFGAGGALTHSGTLTMVQRINRKRDIQAKVDLILETSEAPLLCDIVEALFKRVVVP